MFYQWSINGCYVFISGITGLLMVGVCSINCIRGLFIHAPAAHPPRRPTQTSGVAQSNFSATASQNRIATNSTSRWSGRPKPSLSRPNPSMSRWSGRPQYILAAASSRCVSQRLLGCAVAVPKSAPKVAFSALVASANGRRAMSVWRRLCLEIDSKIVDARRRRVVGLSRPIRSL